MSLRLYIMKSALAVLSLSALALAAPTPDAQGTTLSIDRSRHAIQTRDDGTVDWNWVLGSLKGTLLKYNPNVDLSGTDLANVSPILKRATNANEALTDGVDGQEDELYYGTGTVGTKSKQTFTFDFDTGSSDTFIPGPNCQGCYGTTKYNQQGVDEHNTTTVTYGSGQVSGENYLDSVTVAGLTATNQNVISLTQATGFDGPNNALMGMAFQSIANSDSTPFFFNLIKQGKVNPTEFSFYLGRAKSGTQGRSEMTLGGRDRSRYTGAFTNVPVTSQTYWQTAIDGASVGGKPVNITSGQSAIDTGTTLVLAPNVAAAAIFAQIPGAVPIPGLGGVATLYAYPCNSKPNVALTYAGKSFAINNLDFNFGTLSDGLGLPVLSGTNYCLAGLGGADIDPGTPLWIVGDVFLKNWYSTFHYTNPSSAYVAFAKAAGNQ